MTAYILRRLLLIVPTMIGIMLVTFVVVQFAPGGPVERLIAQLTGTDPGATARFSGGGGDFGGGRPPGGTPGDISAPSKYRGAQGLDPEFVKSLEKQFGFDKPAYERFLMLMWNYFRFDFGESYFRDTSVLELIAERLPVSISLGLWMTLISYAISIPLGIRKAMQDGSRFDVWTEHGDRRRLCDTGLPVRRVPHRAVRRRVVLEHLPVARADIRELGRSSPGRRQILDYFWHLVLPLIAMSLSAFATLTFLTKNSFLEEIRKQYVTTARAKGLTEQPVLYGHVFRNAMLIIIAGFPGAFISAFFAGSLLIETIFSLEGLGLLGFELVMNRDYPVVFATVYIFSLMGLVINLVSDLTYTWVDPRIDFETREV